MNNAFMQNNTTILKVTHYLQTESNKAILPIEGAIKMGRESEIKLSHGSVSAGWGHECSNGKGHSH